MGNKGKKEPMRIKPGSKSPGKVVRSTVESHTVRVQKKTPRRRITFEDDNTDNDSAAAVAQRRLTTAGIIKSKKRSRDEDDGSAAQDSYGGDDDYEDDSDLENSDSDDGSLVSDDFVDGCSDDEANKPKIKENPFKKAKREGSQLSYSVLRLRFLPPEFQEPELVKFLSQFGANVVNCFCVRSRRTHQSKGIAYVQFDDESVLPTVVEECHGMALGGFCLKARVVTLHRPMPSRERVKQRRELAYAYKTKGAPLQQHDIRQKGSIAALIKYSKTEKKNNARLKALGIDYAYHGFREQLRRLPRGSVPPKPNKRHESGKVKCDSNVNEGRDVGGAEQSGKKRRSGGNVQSTVVSSSLVTPAAAVPRGKKAENDNPSEGNKVGSKKRKRPQDGGGTAGSKSPAKPRAGKRSESQTEF